MGLGRRLTPRARVLLSRAAGAGLLVVLCALGIEWAVSVTRAESGVPGYAEVEILVRLFQAVGFPAAVAGFVLWRLDQALRELARGVNELRHDLARRAREEP
jgi:hypothetical protein